AARRFLQCPERELVDRPFGAIRPAGRGAQAHLYRGFGRQPLEDRQAGVRGRAEVEGHLRSQPRQDLQSRPDPSGPGTHYSSRFLSEGMMTTRFWLAAACALTLATGTACNRDTADDT